MAAAALHARRRSSRRLILVRFFSWRAPLCRLCAFRGWDIYSKRTRDDLINTNLCAPPQIMWLRDCCDEVGGRQPWRRGVGGRSASFRKWKWCYPPGGGAYYQICKYFFSASITKSWLRYMGEFTGNTEIGQVPYFTCLKLKIQYFLF